MTARFTAAPLLLVCAIPAVAHRLDEYLQATLITVEKNRIQAEIRLTPGVAVLPIVLAGIDTNSDGVISPAEQRAYSERLLRDLSFRLDGNRLHPRLVSLKFPAIEDMQEGLGEIQLTLVADVPSSGPHRRLVFENRHQSAIGAYLVNCLVPRDPGIRVISQNRNYPQSFYQLDYEQAGFPPAAFSLAWWSRGRAFLAIVALLLLARFATIAARTPPRAWLRSPGCESQ